MVKNLPVNAGDEGGAGSIPGSGRFSGEGNGYPLQYSCLENAMNCSPLGSFVLEILQARILEWFACLPPENLPDPGIKPMSPVSPALRGRFFSTDATWEAQYDHTELDKRDREGITVSGDGCIKQRLNAEIQKWKNFNQMKLILDL